MKPITLNVAKASDDVVRLRVKLHNEIAEICDYYNKKNDIFVKESRRHP